MSPRRRRDAFTLVEAVIAVVIGFVVVASAWALVSVSERTRRNTDAKLQGVHAAILFEEPLAKDLRSLYVDPDHRVETAPDGVGLDFFTLDPARSNLALGQVQLRRVGYRFQPEASAVLRQVDDAPPVRLPGHYERVVFSVHRPGDFRGRPTADPALADRPRPGGFLTYLVTCIPLELTSRPDAAGRPQDRTVVCGALPLAPLVGRRHHAYWLENPTTVAEPGGE